jgi:hypothetical protein
LTTVAKPLLSNITVSKKKCAAWLTPLSLFVIPAKAGIQSYSAGFWVSLWDYDLIGEAWNDANEKIILIF